jgi:hypothetical protein
MVILSWEIECDICPFVSDLVMEIDELFFLFFGPLDFDD